MRYIDGFLNSITMYRLVAYGLAGLAALSVILGFAGILPFGGADLLFAALAFPAACYVLNILLARIARAPENSESSAITGLILFFIFTPALSMSGAVLALCASAIAISSKFVFATGKRHIFNPAGFAAFFLGWSAPTAASWWVGSSVLLPAVLILGLLIVRKIRRFDLFLPFAAAGVASIAAFGLKSGFSLGELVPEAFLSWPLVFFGTIMLTEPQTTPPKRRGRIAYGTVVGLLFGSQWNLGPIYPTPELSLMIGNVFSYAISFRRKIVLKLKERKPIAANLHEFSFAPDALPQFEPGQYLEWTLPSKWSDGRGNRRYFTISSSPTEPDMKLGVKIPPDSSSKFKKGLLELPHGEMILASGLSGDFTLPKDSDAKLVWIAGGIGVTPFRSMAKYLIDTGANRDIALFYAALSPAEFAYRDIFEEAEQKAGLKTIYVITDEAAAPADWNGRTGFISEAMVKEEIPDYLSRIFYLSGPQAMVENYKTLLKRLGVPRANIKTDYFPGF